MIMTLQTKTGGHLGFVLFAGDATAAEGDCIVRALPAKPELIDSEEYRHLCVFRNAGECAYKFENDRDRLSITAPDGLELRFERPAPDERHRETTTDLGIIGELVGKGTSV